MRNNTILEPNYRPAQQAVVYYPLDVMPTQPSDLQRLAGQSYYASSMASFVAQSSADIRHSNSSSPVIPVVAPIEQRFITGEPETLDDLLGLIQFIRNNSINPHPELFKKISALLLTALPNPELQDKINEVSAFFFKYPAQSVVFLDHLFSLNKTSDEYFRIIQRFSPYIKHVNKTALDYLLWDTFTVTSYDKEHIFIDILALFLINDVITQKQYSIFKELTSLHRWIDETISTDSPTLEELNVFSARLVHFSFLVRSDLQYKQRIIAKLAQINRQLTHRASIDAVPLLITSYRMLIFIRNLTGEPVDFSLLTNFLEKLNETQFDRNTLLLMQNMSELILELSEPSAAYRTLKYTFFNKFADLLSYYLKNLTNNESGNQDADRISIIHELIRYIMSHRNASMLQFQDHIHAILKDPQVNLRMILRCAIDFYESSPAFYDYVNLLIDYCLNHFDDIKSLDFGNLHYFIETLAEEIQPTIESLIAALYLIEKLLYLNKISDDPSPYFERTCYQKAIELLVQLNALYNEKASQESDVEMYQKIIQRVELKIKQIEKRIKQTKDVLVITFSTEYQQFALMDNPDTARTRNRVAGFFKPAKPMDFANCNPAHPFIV